MWVALEDEFEYNIINGIWDEEIMDILLKLIMTSNH